MSASIQTIARDLENIVIPLLKEISEKLDNIESLKDLIEAGSAKVISEMKKCHCNKELLEQLKNSPEKQIIPKDDNKVKEERPRLYSFPNNSVGFEKLGTGKNTKSIVWPPKAE